MPDLTLVVPAFRERENLPALLAALEQLLEGRDWEAIVVVDDALDGSDELVRERAQRDGRVRCLHRIGRRGLASACIEGMLASSAPYLAVMDADLQHDESLLPRLFEAARDGGADVVVASRYMEGGSTGELDAGRVRISRLASALGGVLCKGLTDPMSGFFVVRRSFLDRVVRRVYGRGFKILLDLIAAARGQVRIAELPYRMRSRQRGESKLGTRVIAEFFMLMLYHLTGRLLPARFFLFGAVGLTGVGVHLAALTAAFRLHRRQFSRQPGGCDLDRDDQQLLPQQYLHLRRPAAARRRPVAGTRHVLRRLRHRRIDQHRARRMALSAVGHLLGGGPGGSAHRRGVELLHHGLDHLGRIERGEALMFARTAAFRPARADWMQAAGVAAALFALYALSAPRTVALEDDGLFVLSSYFLGIEHPPGYPLFTLLGKLFTRLPFGSVAYRVHLASALFGALSCGALWICARALIEGRLPAYLAAFGLGVSPVFWSQSIIAEVYTLNTFFFLVLVYLGLRVCPPGLETGVPRENRRILPWMALIFGLSLSNHWPLMLLVAPAFAVLLWPMRIEILRRLPLLVFLVVLGLVPYAWMVILSWSGLTISFYGPLESFADLWYFVSRAGYAQVDVSLAADLARPPQVLPVHRWCSCWSSSRCSARRWPRRASSCSGGPSGVRIAAFLAVAFLMPTVVLLLLLGFEYDAISKHVFHVYPLPAYAVVALWMGLGFAWLSQRFKLRPAHAPGRRDRGAGADPGLGARLNLRADHDWAARYAQAVVRTLPQDAILFVAAATSRPGVDRPISTWSRTCGRTSRCISPPAWCSATACSTRCAPSEETRSAR